MKRRSLQVSSRWHKGGTQEAELQLNLSAVCLESSECGELVRMRLERPAWIRSHLVLYVSHICTFDFFLSAKVRSSVLRNLT